MKPSSYDAAVLIFCGSGVLITAEGKRYLGAALGMASFGSLFVNQKVSVWKHELEVLAGISVTQPHAAYAAFTHVLLVGRTM